LNPEELRNDRDHRLELGARAYPGAPSSGRALWLRARYQRRFAFGWDELRIVARGTSLLGQVLFPDEESIGTYLHGPYGTSVFARSLVGAGAEYRFSIVRDAVKVGLFYDQVLYGSLDRTGGATTPQTAGAVGPSLHILLADEFEFGASVSFAWRTGGLLDFAPSLTLGQVF